MKWMKLETKLFWLNGDAGEDTEYEVRALNDTVIDIENEAENDNDYNLSIIQLVIKI